MWAERRLSPAGPNDSLTIDYLTLELWCVIVFRRHPPFLLDGPGLGRPRRDDCTRWLVVLGRQIRDQGTRAGPSAADRSPTSLVNWACCPIGSRRRCGGGTTGLPSSSAACRPRRCHCRTFPSTASRVAHARSTPRAALAGGRWQGDRYRQRADPGSFGACELGFFRAALYHRSSTTMCDGTRRRGLTNRSGSAGERCGRSSRRGRGFWPGNVELGANLSLADPHRHHDAIVIAPQRHLAENT
jgi:hypothetical protein